MHPMLRRRPLPLNMKFPSVQEFENRINKTLETYPYLVAEEDGQVLGYAYASTYYARTAYNWTTELSIYLHEDARGQVWEVSSMMLLKRNLNNGAFCDS